MPATLVVAALSLACSLVFTAQPVRAANCVVVPSRHPWGAFKLGSWKKVRTVTHSYADDGQPEQVRITDTTTTLVQMDRESYTLRVEAEMTVSGVRFKSATRYVRRGFDGEGDDEMVSYQDLRTENVKIGDDEVSSHVQRIIAVSGGTRRVTMVNFSRDVSPYMLRKSTIEYDRQTDSRLGEVVVEVLRTAMPRTILSKKRLVSQIRTVATHRGGRSETFELYSPEIPGGVVEHAAKEFDQDGDLTSSSQLELLGYGIGDGKVEEDHRPRFFRLFRRRRR